jgi:hypothetical protein
MTPANQPADRLSMALVFGAVVGGAALVAAAAVVLLLMTTHL